MNQLEEIIKEIEKRRMSNKPVVVGISGFGGAGKSTLAKQLKEKLRDSEIVSVDDFVIDHLAKRGSDWDGFDWKRFEQEVFGPLSKGERKLSYGVYHWDENTVGRRKEVAAQVFILEGVGIFRESFMKYFDYTIWMDCPLDVANMRGLQRDTEVYKVPHACEWKKIWGPNDRDYFAKHCPDKLADQVVSL